MGKYRNFSSPGKQAVMNGNDQNAGKNKALQRVAKMKKVAVTGSAKG